MSRPAAKRAMPGARLRSQWSFVNRHLDDVSNPKLKYGPTSGAANTQAPSAIRSTAGTITAGVQPLVCTAGAGAS
jgi:hypothetical protein